MAERMGWHYIYKAQTGYVQKNYIILHLVQCLYTVQNVHPQSVYEGLVR